MEQEWKELFGEKTEFIRKERSQGMMWKVNGKVTPAYQENAWDEDEEPITELIFSCEGSHSCALVAMAIVRENSEYTKKK